MKLHNNYAAIALFNLVESLIDTPHESWKCIQLKLSASEEHKNRELYSVFVVKAMTDLLADKDGHIFLCNDGDIFILFQGLLKPIDKKLQSHFEEFDVELIREGRNDGPFSIFDLSKDYREFYQLCEDLYLKSITIPQYARQRVAEHNKQAWFA